MKQNNKTLQPTETKEQILKYEMINTVSHTLGVWMGIILLSMILLKKPPIPRENIWVYLLYMGTFILLFYSSSMYHAVSHQKIKKIFRIFDHSSIFFFIAGTYGPFVVEVLEKPMRTWFLFGIWAIALGGFAFKLLTVGKYDRYVKLTVAIYIAMGWLSLLLARAIVKKANTKTLLFLLLGGIVYTIGAFFYKNKSKKVNHVIWHFFVLLAAALHFVAIYYL